MIVSRVYWEVRVEGYSYDYDSRQEMACAMEFVTDTEALEFFMLLMDLPITVDGEYQLHEDYKNDKVHELIRSRFYIDHGAIRPKTAEVYRILHKEERIA